MTDHADPLQTAVLAPLGRSDHVVVIICDLLCCFNALKLYFKPCLNVTVERHRFCERHQLPSESLTAFASTLRASAEHCNFANTSMDTVVNAQIVDQFVAGMSSSDIRQERVQFIQ